jgi:hypothetical protein
MSGPKFKPGQVVEFSHSERMRPRGTYEIVRMVHSETGEPQYRVRSLHEAHERVVWEHELRPVGKEYSPIPRPDRKHLANVVQVLPEWRAWIGRRRPKGVSNAAVPSETKQHCQVSLVLPFGCHTLETRKAWGPHAYPSYARHPNWIEWRRCIFRRDRFYESCRHG